MKCWMCIGVLSVLGLGGATWAGIGVVKPATVALGPGQCQVVCTDAAGNVKECVVTCDHPENCPVNCLPSCLPSSCELNCAPVGACGSQVDQAADAPAEDASSAPAAQVADMPDDC